MASPNHEHEDRLRTAICGGVKIPDEEWSWFCGTVEAVRFGRGERLVTEGRAVDRAFFLLAGIVRYYVRGASSDREVTFGFDYEGRFATDFDGFFAGTPSRTSAEALETVDAIAIRRSAVDAAYERHPLWDRVGRMLHENQLLRRVDKEHRIRMLSPEQRYRLLIEQQSPLALRLPLKHLAGYLGITPETLSRIRARM